MSVSSSSFPSWSQFSKSGRAYSNVAKISDFTKYSLCARDDVDIRVLFLSLLSGGAALTPKPHKKPPSFLYFVFLHPQTIVFWMGGKETKSTRKIRKWFSDKSAVKTDLATRNGRHQSHSLQRVLVPSLCVW